MLLQWFVNVDIDFEMIQMRKLRKNPLSLCHKKDSNFIYHENYNALAFSAQEQEKYIFIAKTAKGALYIVWFEATVKARVSE